MYNKSLTTISTAPLKKVEKIREHDKKRGRWIYFSKKTYWREVQATGDERRYHKTATEFEKCTVRIKKINKGGNIW